MPFADRAFVLIANRLIHPASEHGLAGWLETDFVCDRQGRRFVPHWHQHKRVRVHFQQLEAWYRTLDQLVAAKEKIEVALYHRLRDLFSFKPDLVLYDITSTYFEGAGPANFAKHGHSRDGKPHNVQVIVAVVMVAGWPIAHHVWAGNEVDHTTVGKAIADLHQRFGFNRLVFVGDRGMVTNDNLDAITAGKHGYLVGLKRRRNEKLDRWLAAVDEAKWINCPVGITAREKTDPPRTRAQEVPSGIDGMRVIIVDSDERRAYEEAMRVKSMERTRQALEKLQARVAAGKLKQPEKIGAAAERLLQRSHGYRYYSWEIHQGGFRYFENAAGLGSEKGIEGKYVIATSESGLSVLEVVAIYKDLSDVERGFRQLKDVLAMRPIYHQIEARVKAHIFVAALALLVQRLLDRRLEEAGIDFSAERAMEALQTVRLVTFRLDDRPERRGVSGGCPDARRVLKALKLTGSEAADTPRGGRNRDVVTIRKFDSCPPRTYVEGPQTWAIPNRQPGCDRARGGRIRRHCLAISGARLTGPFPAASISVEANKTREQSVGLSRHPGNDGEYPELAPIKVASTETWAHPEKMPRRRLISSSRDLADLDGLFPYLSQPPQGRHRHIGGVPTDGDRDQGGTHLLSRRIDVVPCPAEVDLRDTMKIGRLQPRRIARGIAGGNAQRPAEGDDQMREIAAYADSLRRRIERRRLGVGRPVVVLDVMADPVGDRPDSPATGRELTELAARHPGEEVRLAVAGRQGVDQ